MIFNSDKLLFLIKSDLFGNLVGFVTFIISCAGFSVDAGCENLKLTGRCVNSFRKSYLLMALEIAWFRAHF